MNELPVYYPGSSVTVLFRVRNRNSGLPIPLADYRPEAAFYTRLLGRKIRASGSDPERLAIGPVNDYVLKTVIPPDESARLPCGICSVRLTLTHKTDGTRLIAVRKIFNLKENLRDE